MIETKMAVFRDPPTRTADGRFEYDFVVKGKTLLEHATDMNDFLEHENGWVKYKQWPPQTRLGPGRWGTDINVCRIGSALELPPDASEREIAEAVHEGWKHCFNYWFTNEPWKDDNCRHPYQPPGKELTARDKLKRATLHFDQLNDYHKDLCMQMAKFIKTRFF